MESSAFRRQEELEQCRLPRLSRSEENRVCIIIPVGRRSAEKILEGLGS